MAIDVVVNASDNNPPYSTFSAISSVKDGDNTTRLGISQGIPKQNQARQQWEMIYAQAGNAVSSINWTKTGKIFYCTAIILTAKTHAVPVMMDLIFQVPSAVPQFYFDGSLLATAQVDATTTIQMGGFPIFAMRQGDIFQVTGGGLVGDTYNVTLLGYEEFGVLN